MSSSLKSNTLNIAVDFDGTIVFHEFPRLGAPVPGALEVLRELSADPAVNLILYTMRSGAFLEEAVRFCKDHGIKLWAVNENPTQKSWTTSPKVFAHIYIDDAALGCPLETYPNCRRPAVDWIHLRLPLLRRIEEFKQAKG
jgi:hypothetical protein